MVEAPSCLPMGYVREVCAMQHELIWPPRWGFRSMELGRSPEDTMACLQSSFARTVLRRVPRSAKQTEGKQARAEAVKRLERAKRSAGVYSQP